MEKDKAIILALVIIIIALLVALIAMMPYMAKQDTKLTFKGNHTLTQGDSLKIKLTDINGTPIANQTVNVTVTGKDNTNDFHSIATNKKGVATLKMDKSPGKYDVYVSYAGNGNYNGCNATKKVTVEEKTAEVQSVSSSSDTYIERSDGTLTYGYKDGRYGFWTSSGNFIEDKSRALRGEDPVEPFMRDGDFYSQL